MTSTDVEPRSDGLLAHVDALVWAKQLFGLPEPDSVVPLAARASG